MYDEMSTIEPLWDAWSARHARMAACGHAWCIAAEAVVNGATRRRWALGQTKHGGDGSDRGPHGD